MRIVVSRKPSFQPKRKSSRGMLQGSPQTLWQIEGKIYQSLLLPDIYYSNIDTVWIVCVCMLEA